MHHIETRISELLQQQAGFDTGIANTAGVFIVLAMIILLAVIVDYICKVIFKRVIIPVVKRTKATWDDLLLDKKVINNLIYIIPALLIYILVSLIFTQETTLAEWIRRLCSVYMVAVVINFISAILDLTKEIIHHNKNLREKSFHGLFQILKIILFFVGGIIIISIIIEKSPVTLFAGLGASAAILTLVFKDSIVGFVSGVQLSANDMLRVGDWITVPKYNINGYVIEVTLYTVKVQNFDNTITTIPPSALIYESFQNWRGMQESGGRRIKRSINIDMNSIRFCTPEMLDKYRKIGLLKDYIEQKETILYAYNQEHNIDNSVLVNGRRQTNIGVFRAYLERYIESLEPVNTNLHHMVRQLQPTEKGIPIELYFFSSEKNWIKYEQIQSDVFDHVLVIIPEFDLHVFQAPSGHDFVKLKVEDDKDI